MLADLKILRTGYHDLSLYAFDLARFLALADPGHFLLCVFERLLCSGYLKKGCLGILFLCDPDRFNPSCYIARVEGNYAQLVSRLILTYATRDFKNARMFHYVLYS